MIAHNREAAYLDGKNCQWHCGFCWQSAKEKQGGVFTQVTKFKDLFAQWIESRRYKAAGVEAIPSNSKASVAPGFALRFGRCLPKVTRAVLKVTADTRLSELFLTQKGPHNPQACGTTLLADRSGDDRLGTLPSHNGRYTEECDGCTEGRRDYSWACGATAPGTFIWRPDPSSDRSGQLVDNIHDFQDWITAWQLRMWNTGWYCAGCLTYIYDARPYDILSVLERDTQTIYPQSPARNTAKQRKVTRELVGADLPPGMIADATALDNTDQATVSVLFSQASGSTASATNPCVQTWSDPQQRPASPWFAGYLKRCVRDSR